MEKTAIMVIFLVLIIGLGSGCIDELVPVDEQLAEGNVSAYEFEVFVNETNDSIVNTTTFYISDNQSIKVVRMVENTKVIDIIPIETIGSTNQEIVTDIVVIADPANRTDASIETFTRYSLSNNSSDINYNVTEETRRGERRTSIDFEEPITGFVAYTIPQQSGQSFIYISTSNSTVRFVLPQDHTTGNRAIGTARPEPDNVYQDEEARENLVWYDVEEEEEITVKYYTRSAPRSLAIISSLMVLGALIVFLDYRRSKQKLREKRESIEKGTSKKKK